LGIHNYAYTRQLAHTYRVRQIKTGGHAQVRKAKRIDVMFHDSYKVMNFHGYPFMDFNQPEMMTG
jgi:hypothetical protein